MSIGISNNFLAYFLLPRQTFFRMSAYFHYFALELKYFYIAVLPKET